MSTIDRQTGKAFKAVAPQVPEMKAPTAPAAVAWTNFCDRLKHAGHLILSQPGVEDDVMQAETLRFFIRELRSGLEWETEHAISDIPNLFVNDASASGPPGPNQDNAYLKSHLVEEGTYRVRMDTRCIHDVIVSVYDKNYRNPGDYSLRDFKIDDDGMLEFVISPQQHPGNWIPMPEGGNRLSLRIYYVDWDKQMPGHVTIERLDIDNHGAPIPRVEQLADALDKTVDYLESWPYKYPLFQTVYADQIEPNIMRAPVGIPGGGTEIQYGLSRYVLGDDEALIIESDIPDAPYWGFHLYTMPWFSQIDVANRITALNNHQSLISSDGKVRYVVAHRDPGVQNWLDTGGFTTASVFYRWIWSKDSPAPTAKLVKFDDVRAHLPADTPPFDADDRARQLQSRRVHMQRRFRY